jgi:Ca2+/Na+ antiporter
LPELSTCIAASLKKQSDIIIGNIIGSNFFNIMMIIGSASLVKAIPVNAVSMGPDVMTRDIWIMLAVSLFFAAWLFLTGKIGRVMGASFLILYVIYIAWIYIESGTQLQI